MRELQPVPHYIGFATANAVTAYHATAYACVFCNRIYTKEADTSMQVVCADDAGDTVCCPHCKVDCVVPLTAKNPRERVLRWLCFWKEYGFTRYPHEYRHLHNRFVWNDTRTPRKWICYDDPAYDSMLWVASPLPSEHWRRGGAQKVRMQRQYPDGSYGREWVEYLEVEEREDAWLEKTRMATESEMKEEEEDDEVQADRVA